LTLARNTQKEFLIEENLYKTFERKEACRT